MGLTGFQVSPLGFGGSEIGFGGVAQAEVDRIVGAAIDAGINVFDTAECYADSETKLGQALRGKRDDVFLFTKCGHRFPGCPDLPDWSPDLLRASIDHSLTALQTDQVDLIQLHTCSREILEQGDVIRVVEDAKRAGKTQCIGYSGDSETAAFAVNLGAFDTLQTSVSIADQEILDLALPLARDRRMGVIAKRPIANTAWLKGAQPHDAYARPYQDRLTALDFEWLAQDPVAAVGLALRFTVFQPGVSVAIAGVSKAERIAVNAAAIAQGPLPPEMVEAIRARWREVAPAEWVGQQ